MSQEQHTLATKEIEGVMLYGPINNSEYILCTKTTIFSVHEKVGCAPQFSKEVERDVTVYNLRLLH